MLTRENSSSSKQVAQGNVTPNWFLFKMSQKLARHAYTLYVQVFHNAATIAICVQMKCLRICYVRRLQVIWKRLAKKK